MGVEVEVGDKVIELASKDDLDRYHDRMAQAFEFKAELPVELANGKAAPNLTYCFLSLGGPKSGWLWDLMRLTVNGNDPFAAVAGSVIGFLTGNVPPDSNQEPLFPQPFEVGGAIGNVAYYGRQQIVVRPGVFVVLGFKGLPNATQINASGEAIQYRDPAAGQPINTLRVRK